jgi:hypothetical protein
VNSPKLLLTRSSFTVISLAAISFLRSKVFAPWRGEIILRSLTDDGFPLPQEAHLIHIYTTSPLHFGNSNVFMLGSRHNFSKSALLFLLTCWSATLAQTTPPPAKPQDDVVRVYTELVQTDVMVFDKQGNL